MRRCRRPTTTGSSTTSRSRGSALRRERVAKGFPKWDFGRAKRDWRTDLDYDGFDWVGYSVPFRYGGASYSSLDAFKGASGLETNGQIVDKHLCFENFNVSGPSPASVPQDLDLRLKVVGCNAIDSGT